MAQWTFPKTYPRWNRRKDIWHHKGHIQREQMLCQDQRQTDWLFSQTKGVRQGCSLSPTLFNIYINELASALDKSSCPGLTLEGREIKCLLYADDLLLLSPHEEGLHQSLSVLEKYSSDWALPINMEKSKIMIFQKKPRLADKKYELQLGEQFLIMSPVIIIWVWQSQPLVSSILQ